MKKWKFLAMALSLSLLFTACTAGDDDKNTSSMTSSGVVDDVVSDIESGAEDLMSDAEDAVSDVMSGAEDVVSDITDNGNKDTTSKTGDLPIMESL